MRRSLDAAHPLPSRRSARAAEVVPEERMEAMSDMRERLARAMFAAELGPLGRYWHEDEAAGLVGRWYKLAEAAIREVEQERVRRENMVYGDSLHAERMLERRAEAAEVRCAKLEDALEDLVDGLDSNSDPERLGLLEGEWERRVKSARAALASVKEEPVTMSCPTCEQPRRVVEARYLMCTTCHEIFQTPQQLDDSLDAIRAAVKEGKK